MPEISIVIPTYNTSKHLRECLDSVCNQTLRDIEIICIDDGSSDDCVSIIKDYMSRDGRIRLSVHDKNMGLLKSRGDGAKMATGRYIMFLDSDDIYIPETCLELSEIMHETGADFYQFGTEVEPDDNVDKGLVEAYRNFLKPCTEKLLDERVFEGQFNGKFTWHVWNKIYDANLCKTAYEVAGDDYLIFSDDLYASFFLTYYAKHSEGTEKKYYVYRLGYGYTGNTSDEIKRMEVACKNGWFIDNCVEFLKKENKYEKYRDICLREPLLQLGFCVSIWKGLETDSRQEGFDVLKKYWWRPPYDTMLLDMTGMPEKQPNIFRRGLMSLKQEGLVATAKKFFKKL